MPLRLFFLRSRFDHVSGADISRLLGPPSALGTNSAIVQAAVLRGTAFYAGTALGAACGSCRACEVDCGRLSARVFGAAFCGGLDSRSLGCWRRSATPQILAGAPAGRNPLRDLAGEFRFESDSLGQP